MNVRTDVDEAEFQARRARGIGGSEVAMLTGDSRYGGQLALWLRKTGREAPYDAGEDAWWGHTLENLIMDRGETVTGLTIGARQVFFQHPDHPIAICHPDGLGWDWEGEREGLHAWEGVVAVVDAKNRHTEPWPEVPVDIELQLQWNLGVVSAVIGEPILQGLVLVLFKGRTFKVYEIDADPELFAELLDLAETWWAKYVDTDTPPPADGLEHTTEALQHAWQTDNDETVDIDPGLVSRWAAAKETVKQARLDADQLANEIRARLGTAAFGVHPDTKRPLVTWKANAGPIEPEKIAALGFDPDLFREPGPISEDLLRAAGIRGKTLAALRTPGAGDRRLLDKLTKE